MKEINKAISAFSVRRKAHNKYEVYHVDSGDVYRKYVQLTTANRVCGYMNEGWLRGRQDRTRELAGVAEGFDKLCKELNARPEQEVA